MGEMLLRNTDPAKITRQMHSVGLSTTDFFHSLTTALKMRTQTHTRTPAKAFCTAGRSAKLEMKAAMMHTITSEGATTPRVAKMPPMMPRRFCPTKVAVLTAMTPGVHWPMA